MKSLVMKQNIFDKVLLRVSKKKVENKKKTTSINRSSIIIMLFTLFI
jgi:hypothetical protein